MYDEESARQAAEGLFAKNKRRAADSLSRGAYDSAAFYIERSATIMYKYSFVYKDDDLEHMLGLLADVVRTKADHCEAVEESGSVGNKVTLIDSFGFSLRGLAWIYAKGIIDLGYALQYVVPIAAKESEEFRLLRDYLEDVGATILYVPHAGLMTRAPFIVRSILEFGSASVFLHGTPWDVSSLAAIAALPDGVKKHQINLTDHAFWLGSSVFDWCVEFREYGAAVSVKRRGIAPDRLALIPYYPAQAIATVPFSGLPFGEDDAFFVSGGAAYKTEGDIAFPELVSNVLNRHQDLKFLYLGNETPSWFDDIKSEYQNRVYLQKERQDLVEVFRRSIFYLNTYPVYGALMTQIAAYSGKVPVTVMLEGIEPASSLLVGSAVEVDYPSVGDALLEIDRLVSDEGYREARNREMKQSVGSPVEFARVLELLMSGEPLRPAPDFVLNDEKLHSACIGKGAERFGLAKVAFCRDSLRHRTIFDLETWVALFCRAYDKLARRR